MLRRILCIETTCDETAAAIVREDLEVEAAVVASQAALHEQFHGVVPEIAARAHLERILPVVHETFGKAKLGLADVDAIAVATTPGLAGSLLVGLCAAKTLAMTLNKPLIAINHLHAHIYACKIATGEEIFPCVGLIVSGGHTDLYRCLGPAEFEHLGGTIDDAAGEAFDKVASMLGLPYPGGPAISKAAANGDPKAYRFPRPYKNQADEIKFSFSGLKTAVRYEIAGTGKVDFSQLNLSEQIVNDVAASFQEAVVDCLVAKTKLAIKRSGLRHVCVGGGVAANGRFREVLTNELDDMQCKLTIAPIQLCTDNAVMGAIAFETWKAGQTDDLQLDVQAGLVRMS